MFRMSRPNLVQIVAYGGGQIFVLTPCVHTQNAQDFMVNPNMYAMPENFF